MDSSNHKRMDTGIPFCEARGVDRLSNLPEDIVNQILVRVPIRDSVRTSILSRKWMYAWSTLPELTFDKECLLSLNEEAASSPSSIVDHVLLLHNGPIRTFRLFRFLESYNAQVDKWVLHLTRNGIVELDLEFENGIVNEYIMSSCLFSCRQLKVLSLHCYCLTVPPTFEGFLHLSNIKLSIDNLSEVAISCLVSRCPLLETLNLSFLNDINCFNIHGVRLKFLRIQGEFKDIVLVGCPQLIDVGIGFFGGPVYVPHSYSLEKVLGCLPLLERLHIMFDCLPFLASGHVSLRLFHALENLKFLCITLNFENFDEISAALCIFRSSPRLETICIEDHSSVDFFVLNDSYDWESADCEFRLLKKLEIDYMIGMPSAMGFLKFVLANAPALVITSVRLDEEAYIDENRVLKSLLSFPRASAIAKILC